MTMCLPEKWFSKDEHDLTYYTLEGFAIQQPESMMVAIMKNEHGMLATWPATDVLMHKLFYPVKDET